jgi:hypothetical protein
VTVTEEAKRPTIEIGEIKIQEREGGTLEVSERGAFVPLTIKAESVVRVLFREVLAVGQDLDDTRVAVQHETARNRRLVVEWEQDVQARELERQALSERLKRAETRAREQGVELTRMVACMAEELRPLADDDCGKTAAACAAKFDHPNFGGESSPKFRIAQETPPRFTPDDGMALYVRCRDGALYRNPVLLFNEGYIGFGGGGKAELVIWSDMLDGLHPKEVLDRLLGSDGWTITILTGGKGKRRVPGGQDRRELDAIVRPFALDRRIPRPRLNEGSSRYTHRLEQGQGEVVDFPVDPRDASDAEHPVSAQPPKAEKPKGGA